MWITMLAKVFLLAICCRVAAGTYHFDHHEDKHSAPQPYKFGYEVKDKESSQFRHEEGDGHGSVKGSYGYTDEKGHYREVQYVADKNGFRAKVNTNEPGTANQNSAHVEVKSNPQYHETHHVQHTPVYHKPQIVPVYHEVKVAPVHPIKHHHHFKTHSFNHISPLHGFSYKPSLLHKHKPLLGHHSAFGHQNAFSHHNTFGHHNFRKHIGSHGLHFPSFDNVYGFSSFGNDFDGFDDYKHDDIDSLIEEIKNKGHYSNIGGLSGFSGNHDGLSGFSGNHDGLSGFSGKHDGLSGFSGNHDGFSGFDNDKIENIIEELKHKRKYHHGGNHNSFNDNNYHIKEFRNIGNHKYSRSSGD